MPGLLELLPLILLVIGALYLWYSGEYKELARQAASAHCHELGLQLLDQTVVITGIWPVRGDDGRIRFRRRYQFEFASLGDRRYHGQLVLIGRKTISIRLEAYTPPQSD